MLPLVKAPLFSFFVEETSLHPQPRTLQKIQSLGAKIFMNDLDSIDLCLLPKSSVAFTNCLKRIIPIKEARWLSFSA